MKGLTLLPANTSRGTDLPSSPDIIITYRGMCMYGWADCLIGYNLTSDERIIVDSGWRSDQVQDNLLGRPICGQIVDNREVHQGQV